MVAFISSPIKSLKFLPQPLKFQRNFRLDFAQNQERRAKVHVRYAGDPEYKAQFQMLSQELTKNFPNQVTVTGETLKGKSNDFEVAVNDQIIHSKRFGDGFVNKKSLQESSHIVNSIKSVLDGKNLKP